MKPINHKTLLKKSMNARNREVIEKLAKKESDILWLSQMKEAELRSDNLKPVSKQFKDFIKSIVVAVKTLRP